MENNDILALATAAQAKGFDDVSRLVKRLEATIVRNQAYLDRRARRGTHTPTDDAMSEDNEAIAMAIVLLEST
jgi:hypothetical protein